MTKALLRRWRIDPRRCRNSYKRRTGASLPCVVCCGSSSIMDAVAASSRTCPHNGSFVTLLNSDSFVGAALCLHRQLRQVQSNCPLVLLYDDRSADLSTASVALLESTYGAVNMVPITSLVVAFEQRSRASAGELAPGHLRPRVTHGRRLYSDVRQTHAKLWIWALSPQRFPRVAYLDLDVLVLANIDDLLAHDMRGRPLAATPCTRSTKGHFVAGLLLITPNVDELPWLLQFARFAKFPWNGRLPGGTPSLAARTGPLPAWLNNQSHWTNLCAPDDGCSRLDCLPAHHTFPNASDPLTACKMAHGGRWAGARKIDLQSRHCTARHASPRTVDRPARGCCRLESNSGPPLAVG